MMLTTPSQRPPSGADVDDIFFRPVPARNAFEETVERLVHAIKLGVVRHGERLPPERELAPRLGVSRVTLREAIRALQHAGYVESRRGRAGGAFVTHRSTSPASERAARRAAKEMGDGALADALRFRRVLEPGAAEQAAVNRSEDTVALLRQLAEEAAQAGARDYRAADSRLHIAIAEMVGSPSLTTAVADVQAQLSDLLAAIPRLEAAIDHANAQHAAIVQAVADGDGPRARAAMEEHIEATASLVHGFLH